MDIKRRGEVGAIELRKPPESTWTPRRVGPWGPLATFALTVLIGVLFLLVQLGVAIPYVMFSMKGSARSDFRIAASRLETDGFYLGLAELLAGPVAIGFTVLFTWLRKGPFIRSYLALRPVSRLTILSWLLFMLLLTVLLDAVAHVVGYSVTPDWMLAVYRSAEYLPLLILVLLVVAPVFEELLFRGFLFEGMRHSRLGNAGTILLTSVMWASIHLQYEWFYIGQVFVMGLLLGIARVRTRSVVPAVLMHSFANGFAILQLVFESWT